MNQQTHAPEAIPPVGVDIQLRFDSQRGSVSLRVNGIPVSLVNEECGCTDQIVSKVNGDSLATLPCCSPTPRTMGERWRDFRSNTGDYRLFLRFAWFAPVTAALTGLLQFALYQQFFAQETNFLANYGWWLFYLDISVVAMVAVLGYLRSYDLNAPQMLGMMIGMVIGMQGGVMLGAVFGATNGLFVGSLVGMFSGGLSGIYVGCLCGCTMAVIQGLMSGGMAGTMGAMLIGMMLGDHVLVFMPIFTIVNVMILLGLTYLFHEEGVKGGLCKRRQSPGFLSLVSISLLATTALALLMVYGPKGPMAWTG